MESKSPIPLDKGGSFSFDRRFHVEIFRGGMNRLLLRSRRTESEGRIEVMFQYVLRMDIPMGFEGLTIEEMPQEELKKDSWVDLLVELPEGKLFLLFSGANIVGRVFAAACGFGEDDEPDPAQSMFFMM